MKFWLNSNQKMSIRPYYSKNLKSKEVEYFMDLIEQYRAEKVGLITIVSLLKSWALHYELDYLLRQTYLQPFPAELNSILDSGKGRV